MPIYSYQCDQHGSFDMLLPLDESERTHYPCVECGQPSERMAERVSMRPDANWHFGEYVPDHGYLNSSSKIARAKRAKGLETLSGRNDVEAMKKIAADARKDWDAQLDRQTKQVFEENFAGSGIVNSFGELTPDAVNPL